jgi:hypothetical protein
LLIPTVTVIVNALSAVCDSASVARKVKLYTVSPVSFPLSVPLITPVEVFKVIPVGNAPDCTE